MIIHRLQTHNFGCLHDAEFEFSEGLNVIRGPNEAGKSTMQAALLTALFEKASSTKQALRQHRSWGIEQMFTLELDFTAAGQRWHLEKDFAGENVLLTLDDSSERWTDHSEVQNKLAQLLGIDSRDIYESTAAIRQQQIAALKAGGELSDMLQQSVSGVASGVSVSQIIDQLDDTLGDMRRGLNHPAPKHPGPLHLIQEEIARLEGEIGGLEETGGKVGQAWQELREAEVQLQQLEPQIDHVEQLLEKIERHRKLVEQLAGLESEWLRLHQDVERIEQLNREIAELNDKVEELPEVSAEEADKVKELVAGIARSKAGIELHQDQLNELHSQQQQLAAEAKELVSEESPRELMDRAVGLQDEQRAVRAKIDQFEQELHGVQWDLASRDARTRNRRIRLAVGVLLALVGGAGALISSPGWLLLTLVGIGLAATGLFGARPESAAELLERREKIQSGLEETRSRRQFLGEQLQELLAETGADNVASLSGLLSGLSSRQDKLMATIEAVERALKQANRGQEEAQAALDQLVADRFSSPDELLEVHRQREQLRREIDKKCQELKGVVGSEQPNEIAQQLGNMKEDLGKLALERATCQQQLDSPELAHIDLDTLDIERLRRDLEDDQEELQALTEKHREAQFIIEHSDFDAEQQLRAEEQLRAAQQRQQRLREKEEVYQLTHNLLAQAYHETLTRTHGQIEPHLAGLLESMTGGRYRQAQLTEGEIVPQVFPPEKAEGAAAEELSCATREQLYLAVRLSLVQTLWPDEGPPLLLDDPLVNFDEHRDVATAQVLAEFGKQYQVLLFTCSPRFDHFADCLIKLLGPQQAQAG